MKRIFMLVFLWIAVCGAVIYAQTLDEAILTAAITMGRELPAGASVAVIDFISDSENLSEYVLNEFYGAILRNRGVIPVQPNQGQFKSIRDEYNKAGELNSESAKSIGKLLGVQYLITGSIKQNGSLYSIVFIAVNLDVEIKSQYQASINPRSDTQFASLLNIKPQSQPPAASTSRQKPVTIAAIEGITIPVTGNIPVKTITGNTQYTGTVTWSPAVSEIFEHNIQYTATITLTEKNGYTLQGVMANFFKVAGAISVNNDTNTGVVTALFPSTKDPEDAKLKTLGFSLGYGGDGLPLGIITTIHGTFAPFKYSFFEFGVDVSLRTLEDSYYSKIFGYSDTCTVESFLLYPFANYALFLPFGRTKKGERIEGWYTGVGLGVRFVNYTYKFERPILDNTTFTIWDTTVAMNIFTGFNLGIFDISYTVQWDLYYSFPFLKLSIGYVYRFKNTSADSRPSRQTNETSAVQKLGEPAIDSRPGRQTNETPAVLKLGEPTLLQQGLNILPAVPIGGKNLKFEFGGDIWIAKINGQNFLAGDCIFERNGNGYNLTLKTTNVWSGAVEEVIDLFQKIGVPLGPAAGPLRTAAKLAAIAAKWIPLKGSSIVLEYNEGPTASLRLVSH